MILNANRLLTANFIRPVLSAVYTTTSFCVTTKILFHYIVVPLYRLCNSSITFLKNLWADRKSKIAFFFFFSFFGGEHVRFISPLSRKLKLIPL